MTLPDGLLLADKSAWERAGDARVRDEWRTALLDGRIATALPVRYELLFSAKDAAAFAATESALSALRDLPLSATVLRAATAAMRELAELGPLHHRVPLPDLLIGAVAQEHRATVVHEDRHFPLLQRVMAVDTHRLLGPERPPG